MPVEKTVVVTRRWRKPKTETRWCYFFTELIIRKRFCYTLYDGMEDGTRYVWKLWDWPLGWGEERRREWEWCGWGLLTPVSCVSS
jgi:hypothetical protein